VTAPTKGERTRAKLIAAAGALVRRRGYHATGLADVVAAAGAPRGSLYFHFPGGKDQLLQAALAEAGATWRARLEAVIAAAPDVGAAIDGVCDALAASLVESDYQDGLSVRDRRSRGRRAVAGGAGRDRRQLPGVDRAHRRAPRRPRGAGGRGRSLATFVLAAVEGALLLAKVERSRRPLDEVAATLRLLAVGLGPRAGVAEPAAGV
jgi:TetR/AcrR family transcriptional repressor of lmrAB and yxaGH operons